MNTKQDKMTGADIEVERGPSRRLTDDLQGSPLRPAHGAGRPQYVVLTESGWPGSYEVVEARPVMPAVGLKARRGEPEKAEKTFSVQGADEDIVNGIKD